MRRGKIKIEAIIIIAALFLISGSLSYIALASTANFTVGLRVVWPPAVMVQWIAPEGRVGPHGTNWDDYFFLTVKTPDSETFLGAMPYLATTTNAGTYLVTTTFNNVDEEGVYDVYLKGWQHLTRKLDNVFLDEYSLNILNYTQEDNSSPTGTVVLLAGDINDLGTTTSTLGDDVINSVDLSLLLSRIDDDDPTTNLVRENLNQDIVVNSVDLSLLLKNLDAEGDN
ncbi:hypothetical protein KKA13_00920 [Patescibacteria group bacterium]|nr:hypothetical protein [Patescibacteria group bacterium]MBU1613372.1 hypothetical protein [Patescibacteria group bacterium]